MKYLLAIILPDCSPTERVMFNAVDFCPYPTDVCAQTCEYEQCYHKGSLLHTVYNVNRI